MGLFDLGVRNMVLKQVWKRCLNGHFRVRALHTICTIHYVCCDIVSEKIEIEKER